MVHRRQLGALVLLVLAVALTACGGAAATSTPPPPTATPLPPTATPFPPTATPPPPTATSQPTATLPPTLAPPTAAPTRAATSAPASATAAPTTAANPTTAAPQGGTATTLADTQGLCRMAIPAGYAVDASSPDAIDAADGSAFATLSSFPSNGLTLDQTAATFSDTFKHLFSDYQETFRSAGKDRGRDVLGVSFTATVAGQPSAGQFYFLQEGDTVCTITYVQKATGDATPVSVPRDMSDSLTLNKP